MTVSRRQALGVGWAAALGVSRVATVAAQGLEQFGMAEPPCTDDPRVTPAVAVETTFRPGAPRRRVVASAGGGGEPLRFSGSVSGVTCGRIQGARVDLWHADARGHYDAAGFRNRGHQLTDAEGHFEFETVMPGAPAGQAPSLGIRVEVPGRTTLGTYLFFPEHPANARDPRFKPQLVTRLRRAATGRIAVFDIVLPL